MFELYERLIIAIEGGYQFDGFSRFEKSLIEVMLRIDNIKTLKSISKRIEIMELERCVEYIFKIATEKEGALAYELINFELSKMSNPNRKDLKG